MAAHPRLHARGSRDRLLTDAHTVRVLVYTPSEMRLAWVQAELGADRTLALQIAHAVPQIVAGLTEDPPPRPQILIADVDALDPGALLHLHEVRERAWLGRIIALGTAPPALRRSLAIEHVLGPPFVEGALREILTTRGYVAATTRMPVL